MKKLLLLPILGIALSAISCRTVLTIDPMSFKPSERCQPPYPYNQAPVVSDTK